MKKSLFSFACMAAALFMTGCSSEQDEVLDVQNELAQVQFALNVENALGTKTPDTRAISDGSSVNKLVYTVFDASGKPLPGLTKIEKDGKQFPSNENIALTKGQTYTIAFWAQNADCEAYTLDENMNVAVNYTGANNDETRDAFYKTVEVTVSGDAQVPVEMKRPFAQLNLGTTAEDFATAQAAGLDLTQSNVTINSAATSLNLLTGAVSGSQTVKYTLADMPAEVLSVNGKTYKFLSTSYILVADESINGAERATLTSAQFTLKNADESKSLTLKEGLNNIPVQRNYRTNILGTGLLSREVSFDIDIDPIYVGGTEFVDGVVEVGSANDLAQAIANNVVAYGTIRLSNDITLEKRLLVNTGNMITLDLNGHTLTSAEPVSGTALIYVKGGKLTITGNGKVIAAEPTDNTFNYAVVVGGSKSASLTIQSGTFVGIIDAVYVEEAGGTVTIEGGEFDIHTPAADDEFQYKYLLNLNDKAHANGNGSFIVKGGSFHNYNPSASQSEAPEANFVAEGYKVVAEGEWFNVVPAE